MSEENNKNESGKRKGGKRRYFRRRRRKGKKSGKRNEQTSSQGTQNNPANQNQERRSRRRKKRRSRRNHPDRRRRQQEQPQMPEAVHVPETEDYVEPTDVYIYTHVVRPAYRDAFAEYRPEPLFTHVGEEPSQTAAMDRLREEINRQLDEKLGPVPEEEENP